MEKNTKAVGAYEMIKVELIHRKLNYQFINFDD